MPVKKRSQWSLPTYRRTAKASDLICNLSKLHGPSWALSQFCVASAPLRKSGTAKIDPWTDGDPQTDVQGTLWNQKNLLRVRIFHLTPRRIATDIDVTAVGIVRTENIARFPGNRLCHRKLRH